VIASKAQEQFLTFFVGREQFAAPALDVAEVLRPQELIRVPGGPKCLLGITAVRGIPCPVISLARLLGREDIASTDARLISLKHASSIALAVERVGALMAIDTDASGEAEGHKQGYGRLYAVGDGALRTLDLEGLLRSNFPQNFKASSRRHVPIWSEGSAATEATTNLLEFDLALQAYALPLDDVVEVLPAPADIAEIAQSDIEVLGVVNVRGRVIPLVSMNALLGLPSRISKGIIVVRIGAALVGLAVDRLRGILRVPPDTIDNTPAALNSGKGDAQVQSICRVPGEERLVAILSPHRLFRSEKVAHILADGRSESVHDENAVANARPTELFVIFRLGSEEYGLPMAAVEEVVRLPDQMTRIPNAPSFIEGIMNLRGMPVPVIDQRTRFAVDRHSGDRGRLIITSAPGRRVGFIVDAVSELLAIRDDEINTTPELAADAGKLFSRIAALQGGNRLVLLVDPQEMLDRAERDLLASMAGIAPDTAA
jgi:purine-binding chemotaxis protein CheW